MQITKDIYHVGVNDRAITLFEGQYPVSNGMAYNSYLIVDEKIAVMDAVGDDFAHEWLDHIDQIVKGRQPDYLIVQHMEPDHSANITAFMEAYPQARVVASAKALAMMKAFFGKDYAERSMVVKQGDTLSLGKHVLQFIAAPMIHWPEVIVTYDVHDKVLFSADAFGKFGVRDADEPWEDEARRYYMGIVSKYGAQVQALLQKASALDISIICSLHGPVLSENVSRYIALYDRWSSYTPESSGVTIAYTSVYGHTKAAVDRLARTLEQAGVTVAVYDLARADMAQAVADAFRYDRLVLAATTYNADVFPFMKTFIQHLTERGFRKRTVGLIENGSWAPMAAKVMRGMLAESKEITFTDTSVKIVSALNEESIAQVEALAQELINA